MICTTGWSTRTSENRQKADKTPLKCSNNNCYQFNGKSHLVQKIYRDTNDRNSNIRKSRKKRMRKRMSHIIVIIFSIPDSIFFPRLLSSFHCADSLDPFHFPFKLFFISFFSASFESIDIEITHITQVIFCIFCRWFLIISISRTDGDSKDFIVFCILFDH